MTTVVSKEELANLINGSQYREEMTPEMVKLAKNSNLVVLYFASDDLLISDGVVQDEGGFYSKLTKNGFVGEDDENFDHGLYIDIEDDGEFIAKPACSYVPFKIYEDDSLYCIGAVFDYVELLKKFKELLIAEKVYWKEKLDFASQEIKLLDDRISNLKS